jgi:hypothetical protein
LSIRPAVANAEQFNACIGVSRSDVDDTSLCPVSAECVMTDQSDAKNTELEARITALETEVRRLRAEPIRMQSGDVLTLEADGDVSVDEEAALADSLLTHLPHGCRVVVLRKTRAGAVIRPEW